MWWSVHKSIFGIRNYQVSKHVVSVLSNIWPPSLLYANQVLMFLHSTARSADIVQIDPYPVFAPAKRLK